jgi:hypothetical protein
MGARKKLTIATAARSRNLLVARMNQVAAWKERLFARNGFSGSYIKPPP